MKQILMVLMAVTLFSACSDPESDPALIALQEANAELQNELNRKDSSLTSFEEAFTMIQTNLSLISEREVSIQLRSGDVQVGEDVRSEITMDIQAINNLLDQNKQAIAKLNKSLTKYGAENSALKKLIDKLNSDIASKEEDVTYLKENLTAANFTIEILNEMLDSAEFRNEIQSSMIMLQSGELNTAFYAVGPYKELQKNDVLVKEGSIAGIAGSKKLKPDFNRDYFEKIDITQVRNIPLNSKKAEVITSHPTNSYIIEGDAEKSLRIINPISFWETSKYLVVVTD
jgi:hypothetical protein